MHSKAALHRCFERKAVRGSWGRSLLVVVFIGFFQIWLQSSYPQFSPKKRQELRYLSAASGSHLDLGSRFNPTNGPRNEVETLFLSGTLRSQKPGEPLNPREAQFEDRRKY